MQPIENKIAKKQAGYSLVELSVALAIVAVILVGGLMGTRQILLTNNVNNQLKDAAQVIAKVTRQFQNAVDTSKASNENLVPLSYWPKERFTNSLNRSGVFTGEVRGVIPGSYEYIFSNAEKIGVLEPNKGFLYTFYGVPASACADLVAGLDNLSFAIYAGKSTGTKPTTGNTPSGETMFEVKTADSNTFDATNLGKACSSTFSNVDITAVIRM